MVNIRDPLHGTIQLSDTEERLIDAHAMQRLRGIRQLAMAYLVYPGANHTRFEHSLGTLFISDKMGKWAQCTKEELEPLRLSALLHDVGHVAFSHEAEYVLEGHIGDHEKIGERLVREGEIADILSENFSPQSIAALYKKPLGQLISSDIGADRMDYLLRDSHYTGVAYGIVESDRICSSVSLEKSGLFLLERGLEAAESLLVARFTMFSTVYLHKTVRIASRMLQESLRLAIGDSSLAPKQSLSLGDSQMLDLLCSSKSGGEYARRLKERRLFKKAHSFLPAKGFDAEKLEQELSAKCGCSVLVDVPRLSAKASIMVKNEAGKATPLPEKSELVASLTKMQQSRLEALVICEEKWVKKVAAEAKKLL